MGRSTILDAQGHLISFDLRGSSAAPLLVLLSSLGTSIEMWEPQMVTLAGWFRVLRIDHPGHGGEGLTPGPYDVEMLGRRVIDVVDSLGEDSFSVVGLSMGGMIAMWIAARFPDRVNRLALCCTAPAIGSAAFWSDRARRVRKTGERPSKQELAARWFTADFGELNADLVDRLYHQFTQVDAEAYALCCDLLAETDLRDVLADIKAPTLVVAGAADFVISLQSITATTMAVTGAALTVIADGSHLVGIEKPAAVNELLLRHLAGGSVERGTAIRRRTLGDGYVTAQGGGAPRDAFDEFMIKTYWGEVWSRPGLDIRTRRLLNIAMLICLRHEDGIAIHARAALRDGIEPDVIREVVLQAAVAAGVPAANAARSVINKVIEDESAATGATTGAADASPRDR